MNKIKLGISSCLLGEKVRYDGGHKLDRYLSNTLGKFVDWVSVCPEVECGLSIPREAMHLVGPLEFPRLVTIKTKKDYTRQMLDWTQSKIEQLSKENLCGFIFKTKSPSSGVRDIKIYNQEGNVVSHKGVGIFAREVVKSFSILPVEDEGRLHDPMLRENFIERIFVFWRWHQLLDKDYSLAGLVNFHTRHKLLIMAHSPLLLKELGGLVARGKEFAKDQLFDNYIKKLMSGLKNIATIDKNTNVLYHIQGYFKSELSGFEKQELSQLISDYHQHLIPLIVPVVILKHYIYKYNKSYLMQQYFLKPHPLELMLRNHV
jgi:uncharacterized protein YbgA (DUF1722 family)/uncharacterized protein YbbK (DUF523 family)